MLLCDFWAWTAQLLWVVLTHRGVKVLMGRWKGLDGVEV